MCECTRTGALQYLMKRLATCSAGATSNHKCFSLSDTLAMYDLTMYVEF
jgi:hypothetical protein